MNPQCSISLLESALAGILPADDEAALHRHLEECEQCDSALELMAGGTAWCQEAAVLLRADELDADVPTRDEWSEVDFTVEHLEPSDEPNVLGRLGGYDVLEIIGHGGMGVVLKGFDRELKRCVAIKVLAPHLARSSLAKQRFAREAQAAAAVVHPHVLAIHQVQPKGRLPFLVMPLVAGESLAERLTAHGALELKETLRIGMQAAAGLAAAHEQGLVHRDVKPANILLEKGVERAVLTDFGLACAADDVTLTRWGIVAGTPQYMSPEQARGEPLDGRSDLFSLGCVLYEMATGVSPFRTDSVMATMRRLVDDSPRAMWSLNPELPPWFIAIVERLLEKEPSRRFGSAKEVSELLEGCLAHVQQRAAVPLPVALVLHTTRGRWVFNSHQKGVLAMFGTLGVTLLGILLWQVSQAVDNPSPESTSDEAAATQSVKSQPNTANAMAKRERNENPWPTSFPKSLVERLASLKGRLTVPANAKVQELPDRFEITAAPWRTTQLLVDGDLPSRAHSKPGIRDADHKDGEHSNEAKHKDEHAHDPDHKHDHARDADHTHKLSQEEYFADEGKLIVSKDKDKEITLELIGNASFEGSYLNYSARSISMHLGGKNQRMILSGDARFANSSKQVKLSADKITNEEERVLLEGNARVRRNTDSALPELILADRIEFDTATNTMKAN